eukprot:TRINITY_DN93850_c0_g1_i1.p1 TRINITY_DN93850_c0_g1~~TRINITY_DN93850_c0_g1_i1.p1  ORF type:complete len:253 (+),score=49.61 TRINITY_DN93850_c0_g1_i1:23-760(+)
MATTMEERVKAMMGANLKPEMKALISDLGSDFKFPEWKYRMNKIDSCSSEDSGFLPAGAGYPTAQVPGRLVSAAEPTQVSLAGKLPTQTLLHEMVGIDRMDKIAKQLDKGTDVNSLDCMGESPLFWAVSAEAVDYLVREGADIELRNSLCSCSAFYKFACQGKHKPMKALAKHLKKAGKLEEFLNDQASLTQRTPLHAAAHNGFVPTVKELLAMGADRSIEDSYGKTALDLAKSRGFSQIVVLLE